MGYELRRMIRDGAPPGWTPLMRLVAGEIADDARDPDPDRPLPEGAWPWSAIPAEGEVRRGEWREGLAERTGMSARAISRVLAELAAVGYEMRIPITGKDGNPVTDRRGRLVFAAKGHALRFHVPPLPPRPNPQSSPDPASFDGTRPVDKPTMVAGSGKLCVGGRLESSPGTASFDGQRSPLLAPKVAESGDPVSSESPHKDQSPQTQLLPSPPEVEVGARPPGQEPDMEGNGHSRLRTVEEIAAERKRQLDGRLAEIIARRDAEPAAAAAS
jgi:hypothetical protein